jgi:hypothetical protein
MRSIIFLLCSLGSLLPARGAVLIHEYALRGSLNDSLGGPALTSLGGDITALGYIFAANQGLSLRSALPTPANYSLEFSFKLDSTAGATKLIDFHNRADDTGLYQTDGRLNYFPNATAGTVDFAPGTDVHVVLTRDGATDVVTGYVNGKQSFSFVDTALDATHPNDRLYFFADDRFKGGASDASGGTVNYLRMFNGALTASEVNALFLAGPPMAVPEAPVAVLLSLGLVVTLATVRRRR